MKAFSLIETLTVTGIIAALIAVTLPAISGLIKSNSRVAAVDQMMALFDQARSLAIAKGRPAYVVFADAAVPGTYGYRAACIAQDDADLENPPVTVTAWNVMPSGISLYGNPEAASVFTASMGGGRPEFLVAGETKRRAFPYVKFGPTGAVEFPTTSQYACVGLFAGAVNQQGKAVVSKTQEVVPVDQIRLSMFTGRPKYQLGE